MTHVIQQLRTCFTAMCSRNTLSTPGCSTTFAMWSWTRPFFFTWAFQELMDRTFFNHQPQASNFFLQKISTVLRKHPRCLSQLQVHVYRGAFGANVCSVIRRTAVAACSICNQCNQKYHKLPLGLLVTW